MTKKFIYILMACLILCSCTSPKNNRQSNRQSNREDPRPALKDLKGKDLPCDSMLWGMKIDFIGTDRLIVEELSQPKLYSIYKIQKDSCINKTGSILTKGNGHLEVINPTYQATDSALFVADYSGTISKIYSIPYNHIFDRDKWKTTAMPIGHKSLLFPYFIMLNDSICIATGGELNSNKILTGINTQSGEVKEIDFPFPGFSTSANVKPADFLVYCDAQLAKHPSLPRFVYTCRLGRFVEILEMDGTSLSRRIPLYSTYPLYKPSGNHRTIEDGCLRGVVTRVTEKFIYCLITPYTYGEALEKQEYKGLPNYFGDTLHVFDWNGKQIGSFLLDKPACTFCVDPSDKYLLASTMEGEYFVIRKYVPDFN